MFITNNITLVHKPIAVTVKWWFKMQRFPFLHTQNAANSIPPQTKCTQITVIQEVDDLSFNVTTLHADS